MFSVEGTTATRSTAEPELGDRRDRLQHRRRPGHVVLHLVHAGAGLERDAAGVEGDALADQAQGRAGAAAGVAEDDQPRRLAAAAADGDQAAHALGGDLLGAEHLDRDRLVARRRSPRRAPRGSSAWRRWPGCSAGRGPGSAPRRRRAPSRPPRRRPPAPAGSATRSRGGGGSSGSRALEAVEAVGAEDRAGRPALPPRASSSPALRQRPGERARPPAAPPPSPPAPRRRAGARRRASSRLPRPTTSTAASPGCSSSQLLEAALGVAGAGAAPASASGSASPS